MTKIWTQFLSSSEDEEEAEAGLGLSTCVISFEREALKVFITFRGGDGRTNKRGIFSSKLSSFNKLSQF